MNEFSKINFKQLKYMIPIGVFPFLLLFAYNILSMFDSDTEQKVENVKGSEGLNTDLPDASVDKKGIMSKYQSMLSNYANKKKESLVENVEKEENLENLEDEDSFSRIKGAYTNKEENEIDSIKKINEAEEKKLQEAIAMLQKSSTMNQEDDSEARINTKDSRIKNSVYADLERQLQMAENMTEKENSLSEDDKYQRDLAQMKKEILDSIKLANRPLDVNKATESNEQFFNSIKNGNERPGLIKARIDEFVKVKDGSRIRIRLCEDVEIGGDIMEKGNYLYAIVSGFSAQRVKAKVSQAMVNGRIKKVDLSIYDMDCIEGFFVPNSGFRDLVKEIGGEAASDINIDVENGENSLQNIAMQTLQKAFQTTTQALGRHINKNKAKIKYNTEIYLLNSRDITE